MLMSWGEKISYHIGVLGLIGCNSPVNYLYCHTYTICTIIL